jgi:hypothetical protein
LIPYIGPEIIAALCNKAIPARNEPVIGGSLTNQIAKTARSLIRTLRQRIAGHQSEEDSRFAASVHTRSGGYLFLLAAQRHFARAQNRRRDRPRGDNPPHLALGGEGSTK